MLSRAAAGQPAFQPLISSRFFSFPKKYRRKRAPHKILGVAENSTYEEIKSAYLQKAKELHPDRNPNFTEEQFLELKEAFDFYEDIEKGRKRTSNNRATPPQTQVYRKYQDHTTRSDFRTHSDFIKKTMDEERKRKEHEEEEQFKDRQFMKTFVPTVIVMYIITLARQLQFGQIQDASRPPIWKQILLHFMMDKNYTWSALKHKKHVMNRIESNAIRRKEREELERVQLATGEKHEYTRKTVNRTGSDDILAPRMHKMPVVDPSGYRDFNPTTHQTSNRINHGGQNANDEAQRKKEKRQREIDRTREEKYLNLAWTRNSRSSTHKDFNLTSHQTKKRGNKNEEICEDVAPEGNARSTKFRDFNASTHQTKRKASVGKVSIDDLSLDDLQLRAQKEEKRTLHSPQLNFQRNSDSDALK